jgi:hypothetical protein
MLAGDYLTPAAATRCLRICLVSSVEAGRQAGVEQRVRMTMLCRAAVGATVGCGAESLRLKASARRGWVKL